eukprot:4361697-Alexandrium_andersonii.AAC.1
MEMKGAPSAPSPFTQSSFAGPAAGGAVQGSPFPAGEWTLRSKKKPSLAKKYEPQLVADFQQGKA